MIEGKATPRDRQVLAATPPFQLLTHDVIDVLAARMTPCRFGVGAHLVSQGSTSGELYIVVSGGVRVVVAAEDGERRTVAQPKDGVVIGEMSLLTRVPHTADVVADGDVAALRLLASDFDDIAREYPEIIVVLTEILAERLGGEQHDSLGGKQVGDYRIVRCVGRGGMAVVYEATHIETGERVALKMMNHRLVFQPGARARFKREAQMLLEIQHPNVTTVAEQFDAYRTSFLVMEYCDGPSLSQYTERHGRCSEEEVRGLIGQLSAALLYLHSRGVVHRDLKPANVLLTKSGQAKLSDFGLAKPHLAAGGSSLTQEGIVVGTPRYMAPETFTSDEGSTQLSDIYALGCLGIELLTGRPPFRSKDLTALIEEKERWKVPPRSAFGPAISDELYAFIDGCTQRDPADRDVDLVAAQAWAAPLPDPENG